MTHIDIDVFATRGLHGPYAKDRSIFGLPDNIFLYKELLAMKRENCIYNLRLPCLQQWRYQIVIFIDLYYVNIDISKK